MHRISQCLLASFLGVFYSVASAAELKEGDCVVFREGGEGRLFTSPTYWLKGVVAEIGIVEKDAGNCPLEAKALSAYNREERVRLAMAAPCLWVGDAKRSVSVVKVSVTVDSWETPWSRQHGEAGVLFRGAFMDQKLVKGERVDIHSAWLERCD